jgi:hypothetical protein
MVCAEGPYEAPDQAMRTPLRLTCSPKHLQGREVTGQVIGRASCLLLAVLAAVSAVGCSTPDAAKDPDHPLAGTWIRVFPEEGALDTLVLHADGRASGSFAGLDPMAYEPDRWLLNNPLMPGGLCIGNSQRRDCQGYVLRGDTLLLANRRRTAFVRRPADGAQLTPWKGPDNTAHAPRPGAAVSIPRPGAAR